VIAAIAAMGAVISITEVGSEAAAACLTIQPLSHTIARVTAVARAEMVAAEDGGIIVYKVKKLIYGRVPGNTVRARGLAEYYAPGKEHLVFVYREYFRPDGTVHCGLCNRDDMDGDEKHVLACVTSGEFMRPRSNSNVDPGFYIRKSKRIVRARLIKLEGGTSRWKVSDVLWTKPPGFFAGAIVPHQEASGQEEILQGTSEISLSLEPWQLRAEAIVRARDGRPADENATKKAIEKEFRRLTDAELKVGREAILFLRPCDHSDEKELDTVLGIVAEDPNNPDGLDRRAASIREKIDQNVHHFIPG